MKKGINQWAFASNWTLEETFRIAHDAGFDGIELNLQASSPSSHTTKQTSQESKALTMDSSKDEVEEIAELANRYQLELPSLSSDLFWKYSLTSSDRKEAEMARAIVRKMIDVASWLGAKAILVIPGAVDIPWQKSFQPLRYDIAYERSLMAMNELKSYAEKKQVAIALENVWNKFLLSPLELRNFIDSVASEFVGVYLDVGNVLLTGYPEHWIEILNSRIKCVHVKDFRKIVNGLGVFVGLLQGDVDWQNVATALRRIGYTGYLTSEQFPCKYHPERLIYDTAQAIDAILTH